MNIVSVLLLLLTSLVLATEKVGSTLITCFTCNTIEGTENYSKDCPEPKPGSTRGLQCDTCQSIFSNQGSEVVIKRKCGCDYTSAPKEKNSDKVVCCKNDYCNIHASSTSRLATGNSVLLLQLLCVTLTLLWVCVSWEFPLEEDAADGTRPARADATKISCTVAQLPASPATRTPRPLRPHRVALESNQT